MTQKYFFIFYFNIYFLSTTNFFSKLRNFYIYESLNEKLQTLPKPVGIDEKISSKVIKPDQTDHEKQTKKWKRKDIHRKIRLILNFKEMGNPEKEITAIFDSIKGGIRRH